MLLRVHGVHMRLWRVFELNMIGQFFSTVGVGTTGGDVFKIFYVTRAVPDKKTAVAFTVIADRVIGLLALLLFGVVLSLTKLPLLLSNDRHQALRSPLFFCRGRRGGVHDAGLHQPLVPGPSPVRLSHRKLPLVHRGTSSSSRPSSGPPARSASTSSLSSFPCRRTCRSRSWAIAFCARWICIPIS